MFGERYELEGTSRLKQRRWDPQHRAVDKALALEDWERCPGPARFEVLCVFLLTISARSDTLPNSSQNDTIRKINIHLRDLPCEACVQAGWEDVGGIEGDGLEREEKEGEDWRKFHFSKLRKTNCTLLSLFYLQKNCSTKVAQFWI